MKGSRGKRDQKVTHFFAPRVTFGCCCQTVSGAQMAWWEGGGTVGNPGVPQTGLQLTITDSTGR